MFSRNFWLFSAFLLVVALASVAAQSDETMYEEEDSFEITERSKFGKKVQKILKKFFKNITDVCLKKAVAKCKKHWYNPAKVIQCAKHFFSMENAGCLVGS